MNLGPDYRNHLISGHFSVRYSNSCTILVVDIQVPIQFSLLFDNWTHVYHWKKTNKFIIYDKIITPCFDSLAIRQSPYIKDTSSPHRYEPGFKGQHIFQMVGLQNFISHSKFGLFATQPFGFQIPTVFVKLDFGVFEPVMSKCLTTLTKSGLENEGSSI